VGYTLRRVYWKILSLTNIFPSSSCIYKNHLSLSPSLYSLSQSAKKVAFFPWVNKPAMVTITIHKGPKDKHRLCLRNSLTKQHSSQQCTQTQGHIHVHVHVCTYTAAL
jgi:hypothetical protein